MNQGGDTFKFFLQGGMKMARKSRKNVQMGIAEKREMPNYNAAIYARLSVEDKGVEASSIENQILIAHAFLDNHKDLSFVDTYIDNGESGTNFDRPAFFRLIQDLNNGKINCIIVKDLSRFGRNYLETGNYLQDVFPYMGVRFISINDHFDSDFTDNNDELMVSLKSILHDNYAKDISKKVSTAIDVKKKNGNFMGRTPPYGYIVSKSDKIRLEIQEEQAEVVRNIFSWRMEGLGPTAIARKLNDLEVPSQLKIRFMQGYSDGKETALWHGSTVLNILKNPCYFGCLVERKTQKVLYKGGFLEVLPQEKWNLIQNTHAPIISKKMFYDVQDILIQSTLQNSWKGKKYHNKQRADNVFRGMLICGECGSILQRDSGYYPEDGTLVHHFYYCPRKYLKKGACTSSSVSEKELREVIFEVCKRQLALILNIKAIVEDPFEIISLPEAKEKFQLFNLDYRNPFVSGKSCAHKKGQFNKAIDSFEGSTENLETSTKEYNNDLTHFKEKTYQFLQFDYGEKLTNEMCRLFINKIIIKDNYYNIHFAYQSEFEKAIEK